MPNQIWTIQLNTALAATFKAHEHNFCIMVMLISPVSTLWWVGGENSIIKNTKYEN
jgi:hypothetical protein